MSYELNWAIWGLLRLGNLLDGSFFWSIPWKVWPEENLKYFRHQKNIFWALKSEFGDKRPILWALSYLTDINFQVFSYIHFFSTKTLSNVWLFFLFKAFIGKIVQKFAREVLKRAFQKCGSRPPMRYFPKSTKMQFSSWFSFVFFCISRNRWKIRFKTFFNQLDAK